MLGTLPFKGQVLNSLAAYWFEHTRHIIDNHMISSPDPNAIGRVLLETRFPLGMFRAWSYVEPDARCLVYPKPEHTPLPRPSAQSAAGALRTQAVGNGTPFSFTPLNSGEYEVRISRPGEAKARSFRWRLK